MIILGNIRIILKNERIKWKKWVVNEEKEKE